MSEYRHQALIPAPIERVWELVGDPARHPEWFPRVVEVRGDNFEPGATYVQVTQQPLRSITTTLEIERLDDMHELSVQCRDTGTYTRWLLTAARTDTFVEAQFGMDPMGVAYKVFDATAGRIYFRRWIEETREALTRKVSEPPA